VGNQDLENAIKGLEKAVRKFQDKIEFTEWDSEPIMNYLDDLYNTTKKLEAKANKNDEAKKLTKYFSDIEEIFGRVDDEIGGSIKESQHQCKNDKSLPCETVKEVYKSFSKLEHALEHLDREI
jgi:Zn-dependent M32 family carboxypeptidase